MTRFQLLKENENTIFKFVKAGVMSYQIIRDIEIFEQFNQIEMKNKDARYIHLGEVYELTPNRIEQIIYQMQKEA